MRPKTFDRCTPYASFLDLEASVSGKFAGTPADRDGNIANLALASHVHRITRRWLWDTSLHGRWEFRES